MSNTQKNSKVKDLITIGIFNALLIVVFGAIACTIGFFPPILIVLPLISSAIGGLIFMLMITKAPMRGIFIISSALLGLVLFNMAPGGSMLITTLAGGIIGEIIYYLGRKKFISIALGYASYMFGLALGEYYPFIYMQEEYIELYAKKGSQSLPVAQKCIEIMTPELMIILSILTIITSVLGCLWGRKMLHKHFLKAGIA
ncbi:MptD family putative ECF transporter S component [Vallitalea sediminicola]